MRLFGLSLLFILGFVWCPPILAVKTDLDWTAFCNDVRNQTIQNDPSLQNSSTFVCDQDWAPGLLPAEEITVSLPFCIEHAPGYQGSKLGSLTEWVGPLVGFLLPAFAFVVSIPRSFRIPRIDGWFGRSKSHALPGLILSLPLMVLDVAVWIVIVFAFSGPLIAGSIHEAMVDHAVLDSVSKSIKASSQALTSTEMKQARYNIAFVLAGSLDPMSGRLAEKVRSDIVNSRFGPNKLRALINLLPSYSQRVGVPIFFYLGAYIYSLIDAANRRGDNDTAHAIAFGLWYGVIVIGAIVSSSILGIDNPASLEAIFSSTEEPVKGTTTKWHFHDSYFRIVWVWSRGRNFQKWASLPNFYLDDAVCSRVRSLRWRIYAALLAASLIIMTCGTAMTISYLTPLVMIGCRTVTILLYVCSQIGLLLWWLYHNSTWRLQERTSLFPIAWYNSFPSLFMYSWGSICIFAGAFFSVGGTVMQLVGVYRNCLCKAGLRYWLDQSQGVVRLTTDNQDHRDAADYWMVLGIAGIVFAGVMSVLGWLYQARVRARCRMLLESL